MKIRRTSADADRIKSIADMAMALARSDARKQYSVGVEFSLAELIRDEMRSIARQQRHLPSSTDLLGLAVERVTGKVEAALNREVIHLDLGKYIANVRKKLRFPAKEIHALSEKLAESRNVEKLGEKEDAVSDSGRHYVIHELGLREAIQGILVEPAEDCREINIDLLSEQPSWQVHGDWFPYEVFAEEFVFVIDDDGSIYVSTANLPHELREKARALIRDMANLLYRP